MYACVLICMHQLMCEQSKLQTNDLTATVPLRNTDSPVTCMTVL